MKTENVHPLMRKYPGYFTEADAELFAEKGFIRRTVCFSPIVWVSLSRLCDRIGKKTSFYSPSLILSTLLMITVNTKEFPDPRMKIIYDALVKLGPGALDKEDLNG